MFLSDLIDLSPLSAKTFMNFWFVADRPDSLPRGLNFPPASSSHRMILTISCRASSNYPCCKNLSEFDLTSWSAPSRRLFVLEVALNRFTPSRAIITKQLDVEWHDVPRDSDYQSPILSSEGPE